MNRPGNPQPAGWLFKALYRRWQPVEVFTINSSISVIKCGRKDYPIVALAYNDAASLVISAETAITISDFIKSSKRDCTIYLQDGIEFRHESAKTGIFCDQEARYAWFKKSTGTAHCHMSVTDGQLLADVLLEILKKIADQ